MSSVNDVLGFLQFWRETDKTSREDPIARSTAAAAESLIGKQAKLELAQQAIMTEDLRALAQADRAAVQRLRERHMGRAAAPPGGKSDDMGDLIIADDYCVIKSPSTWSRLLSTLLVVVLLVLLIAALAFLAWLWLHQAMPGAQPATPTQPTPGIPAVTVKATEWWEISEVRQPDGTWKEISRRKLRAKPDGTVEEVK